MRRLRLAGIAALAATALVTATTVAVVRRPASRAGTAAAAGGPARAGAPLGRQLSWAVELVARMQEQDEPKGAPDGTTTLTGEWVVTVSGTSDTGTDVACELRRPHITSAGFGDVPAAEVDRLERTLSTRFWVSYQVDGAARQLHFPRDMADDVRNLLALLVTESQLVRPAQAAPQQWTATERDGVGAYSAAYSEIGPREIAKRRLRYLSVDGAGGGGSSPAVNVEIEASEARFALDVRGFVSEATVRDRFYVDMKLGSPGLAVDIRLKLDRVRATEARELVGSLERVRPGLETGPIVTQRVSDEILRERQDARLIKDVTLSQLVEALATGSVEPQTRARLTALLRRRPADVPGALAFARKSDPGAAKVVLESLGAAGTPAAQDGLGALASDGEAPARLRVDAIGALVQAKRPTPSTISALLRLLDAPDPTVSREALFVAGALGSNAREAEPGAAARVEAALLALQDRCRGAGCADVLLAMGNLATPGVLPAIERALRDAGASVRAAAARALRKVDGPSADRLIAATMTGDRDPGVRAAAVRAATARPIGPLIAPLVRLVEADPVEYVRTGAIDAVAGHVDESPLISKALLAAATGDRSPGVQRLARRALGPRFAGNQASTTATKGLP